MTFIKKIIFFNVNGHEIKQKICLIPPTPKVYFKTMMLDRVWRLDWGLNRPHGRETSGSSQRIILPFGKMVICYDIVRCDPLDLSHDYLCGRTYGSNNEIDVPS